MSRKKRTWRERFEETVGGGINDAVEALNDVDSRPERIKPTPVETVIAIVASFAAVLLVVGFMVVVWGVVRFDLGAVRVGVVLDLAMLGVLKLVQVVAQRRARKA